MNFCHSSSSSSPNKGSVSLKGDRETEVEEGEEEGGEGEGTGCPDLFEEEFHVVILKRRLASMGCGFISLAKKLSRC